MIRETDHYLMQVGPAMVDGEERQIYQIVNKEHGVIEYEDSYLPRSIEAMNNLEDKLLEVLGKKKAPFVPQFVDTQPEKDGEEDEEGTTHIH